MKTYHNVWVSNVSACMRGGLANKMASHTSSERVQAGVGGVGVGHEGRGYQVPVACGPDEEREFEAFFIDTGDIVA